MGVQGMRCGANGVYGARFLDTPRGGRQVDVATTESETITSHLHLPNALRTRTGAFACLPAKPQNLLTAAATNRLLLRFIRTWRSRASRCILH